jgi:hypothetical protein
MPQLSFCFTVVPVADLASHVDIIEYPKIYPSYLVLRLVYITSITLAYHISFLRYGMTWSYSLAKEGGGVASFRFESQLAHVQRLFSCPPKPLGLLPGSSSNGAFRGPRSLPRTSSKDSSSYRRRG